MRIYKNQVDLTIKLIKAGKENGLKKLKIKISNKAGVHLGSNVEGIPIKIDFSGDKYMELEIEYA